MSIQRRENSRDRHLHVRQQKRIAQQFEPRPQKGFNFFSVGETFAQEQACDAWRDGPCLPAVGAVRFQELATGRVRPIGGLDATGHVPPNRRAIQLFRRRYDPSAFHRSIYFRRVA
jgi:hypothetical protein